jgi:hypothetical protein
MKTTINNRLLISGMLIIFLGLVAVALWQTNRQTPLDNNIPATRDPLRESAIFSGWAATDIQALRIDDPFSERDVALARNPDGSWLVGDGGVTVDQTIADNVAKTVAFMPYTDIIAGLPASEFVNYGLSVESIWLQIQVILTNNEQHVIAIGGRVPVADGGYYALVDERTEVFVLNRGAVDYLGIFLQQYQTTE